MPTHSVDGRHVTAGATVVLVLLVDWAGAALMLWGAYREWQAGKSAAA